MGSHLNHSNFCLVGCNKDAWKPHTSCHPLLIPISLLVRKHLTGPADLTDDQTNSWCSEPPLLPVPPPDHHHFVIVTRFNPQHPDNKKDPMIFNQDNDHSHWTAWMEHQRVENCRGTYPWGTPPYNFSWVCTPAVLYQRSKAACAVDITDMEDLFNKVSVILSPSHQLKGFPKSWPDTMRMGLDLLETPSLEFPQAF